MTKKCAKCKEIKTLDMFYNYSRSADGKYYYCISCKRYMSKIEVRKNRASYTQRSRKYRATKKGKETIKKVYNNFKKNNPEKYTARTILNNYIQKGLIKKPTICSKCNNKNIKIAGHHKDYSKPLDVIWVCYPCHTLIHNPFNEC